VLCQKPLTPTLGEAEDLVRRIDGKLRLMVHEN
jgi:D-apiose dehydrogenase